MGELFSVNLSGTQQKGTASFSGGKEEKGHVGVIPGKASR